MRVYIFKSKNNEMMKTMKNYGFIADCSAALRFTASLPPFKSRTKRSHPYYYCSRFSYIDSYNSIIIVVIVVVVVTGPIEIKSRNMSINDIQAALDVAYRNNTPRSKEALMYLENFKKHTKAEVLFETIKALASTNSPQNLHFSSQLCKRIVEMVEENALASLRDFLLNTLLRFSSSSQRSIRNFFLVPLCWIVIKSKTWKPETVCLYVSSVLTKEQNGLSVLLEFLRTLPEELGNRATNHLITKKQKKATSDIFRSNIRQYMALFENHAKNFQNEEIQNLAFEAAAAWIDFANFRNMVQILLFMNSSILDHAMKRLVISSTIKTSKTMTSSSKLLTCVFNLYTERCTALKHACRKQRKPFPEAPDFPSLDHRLKELGSSIVPIISTNAQVEGNEEFIFVATEMLISMTRAGLSRVSACPSSSIPSSTITKSFTVGKWEEGGMELRRCSSLSLPLSLSLTNTHTHTHVSTHSKRLFYFPVSLHTTHRYPNPFDTKTYRLTV